LGSCCRGGHCPRIVPILDEIGFEFPACIVDVLGVHDVVAVEYGRRSVAADLHRHLFADSGPDEISYRRPSKVVKNRAVIFEPLGAFGLPAGFAPAALGSDSAGATFHHPQSSPEAGSHPRLAEAPDRFTVDGATVRGFDLRADLDGLRGLIQAIGGVKLVIVDPISAYLPGVDSHVNAEVRSALTPLAALAIDTMVAVVAVTHLSKSPKGRGSAFYRVIGSIGFVAAARATWLFVVDPADEYRRLMLPGKNNLAPKGFGLSFTIEAPHGIPRVVWGPSSDVLADDVPDAEGRKERAEEKEAVAWLRELLSKGAVESTEVQKAAKRDGLKWGAVRDAKAILRIKATKEGFVGSWWWGMPGKEG
jgi:hypothetical protein